MNKSLRKRIKERALYLCEYCLSPERFCTAYYEGDHITPLSAGGKENLIILQILVVVVTITNQTLPTPLTLYQDKLFHYTTPVFTFGQSIFAGMTPIF